MKRFKFLMASAIVFATASAFTTQSVSMEDFYVDTSQGILPLTEAQEFGQCEEALPNQNCKLTRDTNGDYHPTNDGEIWVE